MGELHTRLAVGMLENLAALFLLSITFIDWFIKSIHPAEGKTVPYCSSPGWILMVHEARRAATKSKSNIRQEKKFGTIGDDQ